MILRSSTNPGDFPDSAYAAELRRDSLRLRFPEALEAEYSRFNLAGSRGRIRTWHTTVLVVLAFAVLPSMLFARFGTDPGEGLWSNAAGDPLTLVLACVNVLARAGLVVLAWTALFERFYPRLVLPLSTICHGTWAFICGSEIFGPRPEFLAPLVTDALAAFFFTGLNLRGALLVNAGAIVGLLAGAVRFGADPGLIAAYSPHLAINLLIAALAGLAFERFSRRLFLEHGLLGEMAARDPLTRLKNRRAFDEHLAAVWQQGVRDRRMLAVLMIDVDHFKAYNDRYGHQAGDQTLVRLAEVVQRFTRRPLDIAARYGGEELVLVLYDLDVSSVRQISEQLLQAIRDLRIEHRESPTFPYVTASIGVAIARPAPGRSPEGAVQLADEALYAAKNASRNRVHVLDAEHEKFSTGNFRHKRLRSVS